MDAVRTEDAATFEGWLSAALDVPGAPDPGWAALDANPLAPIPVARLIDADRYSGANPAVTTTPLIGLAEHTNANFFSEDRIFTENDVDVQKRFPFPNRGSVTEQDFDIRVGNAMVKRRYFVKTADGATGYRLATVGLLRDYHQRFGLDSTRFRESPALDEAVYRDYAARLVPRAVTYSTALIDYFFRGRIAAFGEDVSMSLQNQSDEPLNGTFALYYDDQNDVRRPVPGATWTAALAPGATVSGLQFVTPTSPLPKQAGKYLLVFRGALGNESDAVAGTQAVIESAVVPRMIKRKDGTPLGGVVVQTIDVQTEQILSTGVTDQQGKARLTWRAGRTALFTPNVNVFPMYWAGGSSFASGLAGARIIQSSDIGAQGEVAVVTPVLASEWPEEIEPCTERPRFANTPLGVFQRSVEVSEGVLDLLTVTYGVDLATFVRDDNGRETVLCGQGSPDCLDPTSGFVAEDTNRVGQAVGRLVRNVHSTHFRALQGPAGPIGEPICFLEYSEAQVLPVTVVER